MTKVLVIGAGLAGCTVASELLTAGVHVILMDTGCDIGGKVRRYGCKATDKCNNCGLCLATGLWQKIENSKNLELHLLTQLIDLQRENETYIATLKNSKGLTRLEGITWVVVAVGFEPTAVASGGYVELSGNQERIITGSRLEAILLARTDTGIFATPPESIAFVQCYGSRDCHEHAQYCSRVCCGYATRAAKVVKHYYPGCRVAFFYMEMQIVNQGDYYQSLVDAGVEFIKCRPVKITGRCDGEPATVTYDDPATGKRSGDSFDWVVLSDGISPNAKSRQLAEICGFGQDETGFLHSAFYPNVVPIGCAAGPKKIEETYVEAAALAKKILARKKLY